MKQCDGIIYTRETGCFSVSLFYGGYDVWLFQDIKAIRRKVTGGGLIEIILSGFDGDHVYILNKIGNMSDTSSVIDGFKSYSEGREKCGMSFSDMMESLTQNKLE